jgi:hypothetical protein
VIAGIGMDHAAISRLQAALRRTPAPASRLFADSEPGAADGAAGSAAGNAAIGMLLSLRHDGGRCSVTVVAQG